MVPHNSWTISSYLIVYHQSGEMIPCQSSQHRHKSWKKKTLMHRFVYMIYLWYDMWIYLLNLSIYLSIYLSIFLSIYLSMVVALSPVKLAQDLRLYRGPTGPKGPAGPQGGAAGRWITSKPWWSWIIIHRHFNQILMVICRCLLWYYILFRVFRSIAVYSC